MLCMRRITRAVLGIISIAAFVVVTTLYLETAIISVAALLFIGLLYTVQQVREHATDTV